jgi:hypothetical protein
LVNQNVWVCAFLKEAREPHTEGIISYPNILLEANLGMPSWVELGSLLELFFNFVKVIAKW